MNGNMVGLVYGNTTPNLQSIELFASTPYIDFHYGNYTGDYTCRLIADANNTLTLVGNMNVSNNILTNSQTSAGQSNEALGSLVHFDGKPFVYIDGNKHHFNIVD